MPITRRRSVCLLRPGDVPAAHHGFEVVGIFNPAAAEVGGEVVLLVRVAECPSPRPGAQPRLRPLPRFEPGQGPVIDWVEEQDYDWFDRRVVRRLGAGQARLTFLSNLRVVRLQDWTGLRRIEDQPFEAESIYEEYGVEDPRITKIGDDYWVTYVAVSRYGVTTALTVTRDFEHFERYGVIFGPDNKDVVLFPERAGGDLVAIHRPVSAAGFCRPEMWLARSPDGIHWGRHERLYGGESAWESDRVGAGPPPVLVPEGWLFVYHASSRPGQGQFAGQYAAGALLLDRDQPARILAKSQGPILIPTGPDETSGFTPGVIFPTGLVARGDSLWIYAGAADERVVAIEINQRELLEQMEWV